MSETGHAINIEGLRELIDQCRTYPQYNPHTPQITIPQMENLYQDSTQKLQQTQQAKARYTIAVNDRQNKFQQLKPLCTRILSLLISTGTTIQTVHDARHYVYKIRGTRAKSTNSTTITTLQKHSTSQRSYDMLIEHFSSLLQLLTKIDQYQPNEPELQIPQLQTYLQQLKTANSNLTIAQINYKNAQIERDKTLYHNEYSLINTVKKVKAYIKSLFGPRSPELRLLNRINFKVSNHNPSIYTITLTTIPNTIRTIHTCL